MANWHWLVWKLFTHMRRSSFHANCACAFQLPCPQQCRFAILYVWLRVVITGPVSGCFKGNLDGRWLFSLAYPFFCIIYYTYQIWALYPPTLVFVKESLLIQPTKASFQLLGSLGRGGFDVLSPADYCGWFPELFHWSSYFQNCIIV